MIEFHVIRDGMLDFNDDIKVSEYFKKLGYGCSGSGAGFGQRDMWFYSIVRNPKTNSAKKIKKGLERVLNTNRVWVSRIKNDN